MDASDTNHTTTTPPTTDDGWQALPLRARTLSTWTNGLVGAALGIAALVPIAALLPGALKLVAGLAVLVAFPLLGVWFARKQYRYTRWRLDDAGFGLRHGRLWHSETRVPASRVQHLDVKHGPLERRFDLATLVVHTAGTRNSAVEAWGLDRADAERLRDLLARQIDRDDDAR